MKSGSIELRNNFNFYLNKDLWIIKFRLNKILLLFIVIYHFCRFWKKKKSPYPFFIYIWVSWFKGSQQVGYITGLGFSLYPKSCSSSNKCFDAGWGLENKTEGLELEMRGEMLWVNKANWSIDQRCGSCNGLLWHNL